MLSQLADLLFQEPWALLPSRHAALRAEVRAHLEALRADDPAGPDGRPCGPQTIVAGSVAVIPVYGVLARHLAWYEVDYFGMCDYNTIDQQIGLAVGDPLIDTLVLDFRSPGGMLRGLEETADVLFACPKRKIAYTSDQMCSAAWVLASQCDQIMAAPSSTVGGVAVITAVLDQSAAFAQQGLKIEVFRTGSLKNAPAPGEPLTDEARAFYQARVDEEEQRMLALVGRSRQVDIPALKGAWLRASSAVGVGLVDALVPSLPELVHMIHQAQQQSARV
ncbi:MAG: S49 family peptidase [Verrucomicrobia bacterium]|nr:S49 family peptidase [Verrucomicrobiota bacterium]